MRTKPFYGTVDLTVSSSELLQLSTALNELLREVDWASCTEKGCGCPSSQRYALACDACKWLDKFLDEAAERQPQP